MSKISSILVVTVLGAGVLLWAPGQAQAQHHHGGHGGHAHAQHYHGGHGHYGGHAHHGGFGHYGGHAYHGGLNYYGGHHHGHHHHAQNYYPYTSAYTYPNYGYSSYAYPSGYTGNYYAAPQQSYSAQPNYAPAVSAPTGGATLQVLMPDPQGQVWVDSQQTTSTGTTRTFATPALDPGQTYSYRVSAAWHQGGRLVTAERQVTVAAGKTSTVDFSQPGEPN